MALRRIIHACGWALAASLAFPASSFAQSHPEFVPLGRVSAALYKPDSGPVPHVAFLVSHRTGNNLNNSACKELAKRGFLALCWNTRFVNNEAAVHWEDIAFDVKTTVDYRMIRGISMVKPLDSLEKLSILPFWNGHSAGHWEGDTLIIQSAGFNESTFADATGLPHSDQLTTTERVRKINGGKQLEDVITIHDPVYYARDWQARFVYDNHDGMRMMEYICGETHRDISRIKGVSEARAANAARAQGR